MAKLYLLKWLKWFSHLVGQVHVFEVDHIRNVGRVVMWVVPRPAGAALVVVVQHPLHRAHVTLRLLTEDITSNTNKLLNVQLIELSRVIR